MSHLSRAFHGAGIMAGTFGTAISLAGVIGLIVTTASFCPESVGPERCRAASRNAAGLTSAGLAAAGVGGLLLLSAAVADPEA